VERRRQPKFFVAKERDKAAAPKFTTTLISAVLRPSDAT